jgi:hypothetical protein
MIKKTLLRSEDLYIQFTDEELKNLNLKAGDKLSWEKVEDGFLLKKMETLELDLADFSRENLEMLITLSVEKDVSVNDVIVEILSNVINKTNV